MTIPLAKVHLTVPPSDIFYISWNLDACDGLGFLQTDDARNGHVTIFTPASLLDELKSFIEGHRAEGIEITTDLIEEE